MSRTLKEIRSLALFLLLGIGVGEAVQQLYKLLG